MNWRVDHSQADGMRKGREGEEDQFNLSM